MATTSVLSPELLKIVLEAKPRAPVPVTFSAARRRFERATKHHQRISALRPREQSSLGGASYALMEGNFIVASGWLDTVEAWCREEGVLQECEYLVEAV